MIGGLIIGGSAFSAGVVAGRLSCQVVSPGQSRAAKLAMVAGAGLALFGVWSIYTRLSQ